MPSVIRNKKYKYLRAGFPTTVKTTPLSFADGENLFLVHSLFCKNYKAAPKSEFLFNLYIKTCPFERITQCEFHPIWLPNSVGEVLLEEYRRSDGTSVQGICEGVHSNLVTTAFCPGELIDPPERVSKPPTSVKAFQNLFPFGDPLWDANKRVFPNVTTHPFVGAEQSLFS